ncbi:MAG: hypothetical protein HOJ90_12060 [Alphaproteobacteria bacterium]|nr:hypothetical protein [Alphaproteobacteria bacterium]
MNALAVKPRPVLQPPALVAHADWSIDPRKRSMARAVRMANGNYLALAPEPVSNLDDLFARLKAASGVGETAFVGFDFPLGVPLAYAKSARLDRFMTALPKFGRGAWKHFYDPANSEDEISPKRPFYPNRPGGTRRQQLIDALKLSGANELFRQCDHPTDLRSAANPMFWTMGAQQVGKAAISGWRDLIAPALRQDQTLHIWPFDGRLTELLTRPGITVAETYPGEVYGHLKLQIAASNKSKLNMDHRREDASRLLGWANENNVQLSAALASDIRDGFGDSSDGEDRFDATVGLFGMLNVIFGHRTSGEPATPVVRQIEGWILGLDAKTLKSPAR